MVRYRRNRLPGGRFFFTVALADRHSRALVEHVGALRDSFRMAQSKRPFATEAIVILPDHLHAILTLPEGDHDFAGRWRRIKSYFTRQVAALHPGLQPNRRGEYGLWQRRFWEHTIRDDNDLARHIDYIHFNPVKHGHVLHVRDWPYSSFHRYVREGVLSDDWGGRREHDAGFGEP
jgi:putative transposase